MPLLLQAQDLTFRYPHAASPTIAALNLTIEAHDELTIVGASGSGKTTLARLLCGLLQPEAGEIKTFPAPGMYPKPAIVFQNPENQLVGTTVEEDIAFGPGNLALDPRVIRERVEEVVHLCGLTALRRRKVHTLSGGEKQRVAIASALALHPLCLILDEATAMLDCAAQEELAQALVNVKQRYGTAIIRLTYSPHNALTAERVAILHQGTIVATGAPAEVMWDPQQMEAWGLEPPALYRMARIFNQHNYSACRNSRTIEELASTLWHSCLTV